MIENAKNKDMADADVETPVEVKPVVSVKGDQAYHFSGAGEYYPLTINAESEEKAMEIYFQKRVPLKPL